MAGRILLFALPTGVVVFLGASSPAIAQRTPRFFFPVLAAVGAALVLYALAASVVRFLRSYRRHQRFDVLPVVVSLVATVFLVVLPSTRLLGVITAPLGGAPRILAGFGDWVSAEGYPRLSPHRGIDFSGKISADVLAAADGRVAVAEDSRDLCGLKVVIVHEPYGYLTIYCHSSALTVQPGEMVKRGQRIGALGTTGQRAWPGFEHVHLELWRRPGHLEDPAPWIGGCFNGNNVYPADRLVLTYPVKC